MRTSTLKKLLKLLDCEPLLRLKDVQEQLGYVCRQTIINLRADKSSGFPEPFHIGGQLRWRPKDIRRWLNSKAKNSGNP